LVRKTRYFKQTYYLDKDQLKKEYRLLSKKYHPDLGGSTELMATINLEYEALKNDPFNKPKPSHKGDGYKQPEYQQETTVWRRQEIIDLLLNMDIDCTIWDEIIIANSKGGRAYDMRNQLKDVGFWWDPINKHWYWQKSHSKRKSMG